MAEFSWAARGAFLERVGGERAQGRTAAGKHAEDGAERGTEQHRRPGTAEIFARRPQPGDLLRRKTPRLLRLRQIGDDLDKSENADRKGSGVGSIYVHGD